MEDAKQNMKDYIEEDLDETSNGILNKLCNIFICTYGIADIALIFYLIFYYTSK